MATKAEPPPKPEPAPEAKPKTNPKPEPKTDPNAKLEDNPNAKKGKSDTSIATSDVSQKSRNSNTRTKSTYSRQSDTDAETIPEPKSEVESCKQAFCTCNVIPSNLTKIGNLINGPTYSCGCGGPEECDEDNIDVQPSQDNLCPNDRPDNRLKTWIKEISMRNCIAQRLVRRTGKTCHELLFNRTATVNERDKKTIQRMLAHADRMEPVNRRTFKRQTFNHCDSGVCEYVLLAAAPTSDKYIEISGLSAMTKEEVLGENYIVQESQWMQSKVLAQRIKAKGRDIKRVLKFFPDIDQLFVVGKASIIHPPPSPPPTPPPKPKRSSMKGAADRSDSSVTTSANSSETILLNTCDKLKILSNCIRRSQLNISREDIKHSIHGSDTKLKNGDPSLKRKRKHKAEGNKNKKTSYA